MASIKGQAVGVEGVVDATYLRLRELDRRGFAVGAEDHFVGVVLFDELPGAAHRNPDP